MRGTVRKRGTTWGYQVFDGRDEQGRRKYVTKAGFRTKAEAQRALNAALTALDQGKYVAPSTMTVAQFSDEWLAAMTTTLRPTTHLTYRRNMDRYVIPAMGHVKLQDVTAGPVAGAVRRDAGNAVGQDRAQRLRHRSTDAGRCGQVGLLGAQPQRCCGLAQVQYPRNEDLDA